MHLRASTLELRSAARRLTRSPCTSLATVALLGIASAVCATVWHSAHVVSAPLPFPRSSRIVTVNETLRERVRGVSYRSYAAWKENAKSFAAFAAFQQLNEINLDIGGQISLLRGAAVTEDYFRIFQIVPVAGRLFAAEEYQSNAPVAVLAETVWRDRFGADPSLVGRTVLLNGALHRVVGILRRTPVYPDLGWSGVWIPFSLDAATQLREPRVRRLRAVGRLREDVGIPVASRELNAIQERLGKEYPETHAACGALVQEARRSVIGSIERFLGLLQLAALLLLALAAGNAASLAVAGNASYAAEIGIRQWLGAGPLHRFWCGAAPQLVMGGCAAWTAVFAGPLLQWQISGWATNLLPRLDEAEPFSAGMLGFSAAAGVLALAVTAAAGGLHALVAPLMLTSFSGGRTAAGGTGFARVRTVVIAADIALTLPLLMVALLLTVTVLRLRHTDSGFDRPGMLSFRVYLPTVSYPDYTTKASFYRRTLEALEAVPGVTAAGGTSDIPLDGPQGVWTIFAEGAPLPSPGNEMIAHTKYVSPGYFRALGVRFTAGRNFDEREAWQSHRGIVVNAELARRLWPGQDPIGKRLKADRHGEWEQVIGVVADTRQRGLREPPFPEVYRSYAIYQAYPALGRHLAFLVRAAQPAVRLQRSLEAAVASVDPGIAPADFRTLEQIAEAGYAIERLLSRAAAALSLFAIFISLAGVHAVISYSVSRRSAEVAIRLALGAPRARVVAELLKDTAPGVIAGACLGLAFAAAMAKAAQALLFGVHPLEPWVLGVALSVTMLTGALAMAIPAAKASRMNPVLHLGR